MNKLCFSEISEYRSLSTLATIAIVIFLNRKYRVNEYACTNRHILITRNPLKSDVLPDGLYTSVALFHKHYTYCILMTSL